MKPEEELKRLNRLIRQFEAVYKSTGDPYQRDRVSRELKKLKDYRGKVESFHLIDQEALKEPAAEDELQGFPFLRDLLAGGTKKEFADKEILHLFLYFSYFEKEFLPLLSEKKLKLDFKYSLERDGFYHRFANLNRQYLDYEEDAARLGQYQGQHEDEMRRRNVKMKRNLILEMNRFFKRLETFTNDLVEDIEAEGLKCLNSSDGLHFDALEGNKYLNGLTVHEALVRVNAFSTEVIAYLNVPNIAPQE